MNYEFNFLNILNTLFEMLCFIYIKLDSHYEGEKLLHRSQSKSIPMILTISEVPILK